MSELDRTLLSRREALVLCTAAGAATLIRSHDARAQGAPQKILSRVIPRSGERLPAIGLGTAIVFNVGADPKKLADCAAVVRGLVDGGGTVVDTAPSYGTAEAVVGSVLSEAELRKKVFLSTKLEHQSFGDVGAGLRDSMQRLRTDKVDLLQLHNVDDPQQDLGPLRALKSQALCRYIGITTTFGGGYDAAEAILRRQKPDFLEINYAIDNRDAEARLLPAAAEVGAAVLVALPFGRGRLFRLALGRKLPDWAAEFDCVSWGQFFLKFILGNPAITAIIPGTDKVAHMTDNLGAGLGRLPDAAMRARMVQYIASLA